MDKRYIILGAALVLLLIFGGIFLVRSRKPESVTLNFVTSADEEKNLDGIIDSFQQANPSIKINFVKKDKSKFENESLNLLSTGKIDIWGIPVNWLPKHHNKLAPAPISKENFAKVYPKAVTAQNTIDNTVYAYPLYLDALVLYIGYNAKFAVGGNLSMEQQTLVSKTPSSWEQLADQTKLLTKKSNGLITASSIAMGSAGLEQAPDILTLMMLQYGAQMTNAEQSSATFQTAYNKFGMGDFPGEKALDFYTSFSRSDNPNYTFSDSLGEAIRVFTNEKAVYYIDYLSHEQDIKRINPDFNYNIALVPQVKETKNPVYYLNYETLTVPNTSKNQTAAWKFINYLNSKDVINDYYIASKKPPALADNLKENNSIMTDMVGSAQDWYNPDPIETDKIFREAINDVILQGKTPQTALEGAAVKVTALLEALKD